MIKRLGHKLYNFASSIGHKLNEGIGYLGRKMYDHRYKIAGALGALAVGAHLKYNAPGLTPAVPGELEFQYRKHIQPKIDGIRDVRNAYSSLPNAAERAGFMDQMGDMGVPRPVFYGL